MPAGSVSISSSPTEEATSTMQDTKEAAVNENTAQTESQGAGDAAPETEQGATSEGNQMSAATASLGSLADCGGSQSIVNNYWWPPQLGQDVILVENEVGHAAKVTAINCVDPWKSRVNLVVFPNLSIPKVRENVAFYPAKEARAHHVSESHSEPVPAVYCYTPN
jgi:hypothetical protein